MGREIKTNDKGKLLLWSTVADDMVAEFDNIKELKQYVADEIISNAKLKAVEELMSFPYGWVIDDKMDFSEESRTGKSDYLDWYNSLLRSYETEADFRQQINLKLEGLIK
ncbi:hypothetical protein ABEY43_06920 [Priestia megaterium]